MCQTFRLLAASKIVGVMILYVLKYKLIFIVTSYQIVTLKLLFSLNSLTIFTVITASM